MGEHPDLKLNQNYFNKDEVGADVACKISETSELMEGSDEEKGDEEFEMLEQGSPREAAWRNIVGE